MSTPRRESSGPEVEVVRKPQLGESTAAEPSTATDEAKA
jgi:hypothetical protein